MKRINALLSWIALALLCSACAVQRFPPPSVTVTPAPPPTPANEFGVKATREFMVAIGGQPGTQLLEFVAQSGAFPVNNEKRYFLAFLTDDDFVKFDIQMKQFGCPASLTTRKDLVYVYQGDMSDRIKLVGDKGPDGRDFTCNPSGDVKWITVTFFELPKPPGAYLFDEKPLTKNVVTLDAFYEQPVVK